MAIYKSSIILVLCYFFLVPIASAQQVGIGTRVPHASALLDVNTGTKDGGVLFPRVNLLHNADQTTISAPAVGLTVFNLQNAGTFPNNVEANRYYSWEGIKWIDLSDMDLVRRLLLPQVFFTQVTTDQILSASDLTTINAGNELVVTFDNASVTVNNGDHVYLNNDMFTLNSEGVYEVSGFIGYIPRTGTSFNTTTAVTNLEYNIQLSSGGGAWNTVASATAVWGISVGQYVRTLIIPPININNILPGDKLRAVVTKTLGDNHGSGGGIVAIRSPEGFKIAKSMRILKVK